MSMSGPKTGWRVRVAGRIFSSATQNFGRRCAVSFCTPRASGALLERVALLLDLE